MTKRKFVVLVLRLFMLYLVFDLVFHLLDFFGALPNLNPRDYISYLGQSLASLISLALATILWRKSEWLKKKVTPADKKTRWLNPAENPYLIVISIIGIWEVFHNLSGVLSDVWFMYPSNHKPYVFDLMFEGLWTSKLIFDSIQILFGTWLFLQPWLFQKLIKKFNTDIDPLEEVPAISIPPE